LLDKQRKFYTKLTYSYLSKQSYLGVVKATKHNNNYKTIFYYKTTQGAYYKNIKS